MKILKYKNLKVIDYPEKGCIEIAGMLYTYELFKVFGEGGIKLNTPFKIIERSDKTITISEIKQ